MLEKYGCRVTPAGDGDEAVKQLKQRNFDLVLMDCQMPVMDGYEATQIIRKLEEHQKRSRTPIIAFTAHALKGDDDKCFAVGMDDYIPKPIRQGDMDRILIKWLPKGKRVNIDVGEDGDRQTPPDVSASLDRDVFKIFSKLMGENLVSILMQYFEASSHYRQTIRSSFNTLDFKAIHDAAHPLKSCSRQIGALKVADIAAQIEKLSKDPAPNPKALKPLVDQLEKALQDVTETIQARMTVSGG
jgi:CheY-like chemotaxis protein